MNERKDGKVSINDYALTAWSRTLSTGRLSIELRGNVPGDMLDTKTSIKVNGARCAITQCKTKNGKSMLYVSGFCRVDGELHRVALFAVPNKKGGLTLVNSRLIKQ